MVNMVVFFLLRTVTDVDRNVCNIIAVITAMIFAYLVNKLFVFRWHVKNAGELAREIFTFFGARVVSMAVEVMGFAFMCDTFRLNEPLSKVMVQFLVIVLNYVFSSLFVFREKKNTPREVLEQNWSWMLAMALVAVFMLVVMLIGRVAPFGDKSFSLIDSIHQYVPFMSDYQEKLRNEGSLFYTWNVGMGMNFQSLMLYYMASPLNFLLLLVSRKGIVAAFSIMVALKIALSAGAFGYFLSRRGKKTQNHLLITAFAVAYALNNYMVGYNWNVNWMDCMVLFPLILLGFDRLMRGDSPRLYVLALFGCLYCNYYISFMICIFLVLWFFAADHRSVKDFFMNGIRFAWTSLLAAGMAAVSLVTAYIAIMKTASAGTKFPKNEVYGSYFAQWKQMLIMQRPINAQTFDGGVNLYAGTILILLFFLYMTSSRIKLKDKVLKGAIAALLLVSFNTTRLNFIWHGFHDQYGIPNRFSFLFITLLLIMGYEALTRLKRVHLARIIIASVLAISWPVVLMKKTDVTGMKKAEVVAAISALMIFAYAILVVARKEKILRFRTTTILIGIFYIVEVMTNAGVGFYQRGLCDAGYYMQHVNSMMKTKETVDARKAEENILFAREEQAKAIMLDENTLNTLPGIGTFCSTARGEMVESMGSLGFYTGANEYLYTGATMLTNDIFGVRYIYKREGDYFPVDGYREVETDSPVSVYENTGALPIAFAVREELKDWKVSGIRSADVQNRFAMQAAGTDSVFEDMPVDYQLKGENCDVNIAATSWEVVNYHAQSSAKIAFTASFAVPEAGRYYVNIRANYMEKVVLRVNSRELANGRYWTQMFDLGERQKGDVVELDIRFGSDYSPSGSVSLYLSRVNKDNLAEMEKRLSAGGIRLDEFDDGYLTGTVKANKGDILFTSIPYDEGWSVKVNGKKAKTFRLGGSFLGVDLEEGENKIEMFFRPTGYFGGMLITIFSWMLFVFILRKRKKLLALKAAGAGANESAGAGANEPAGAGESIESAAMESGVF